METDTTQRLKSSYLQGDRSVNIQKHLQEKEKLEKSGLANIDIVDGQKEMGKDEFLKLLVAQLSHQDPTAPMKDQEFIAQMAQFSSLEQMHNIAGNLGTMSDRQAMNLVGKFISGTDKVSGADVAGMVDAMFFDESGTAMFKVGDQAIRVSDIKMVSEPSIVERHAQAALESVRKGSGFSSAPVVSGSPGKPAGAEPAAKNREASPDASGVIPAPDFLPEESRNRIPGKAEKTERPGSEAKESEKAKSPDLSFLEKIRGGEAYGRNLEKVVEESHFFAV